MRARTTLAAVVLAASAAYFGVRHLPKAFPPKPDIFALDPDQKQLLKEARDAYAPYPVLSFTETTTVDDLRAVLDAAPEVPVPPATAQIPATLTPEQARRHRADLNRLMAEFLLYTVVKQDPHAYAVWRLGRGDRLMNMDELKRVHYIGDAWLEFTGEPIPDDATPESCFRLVADRHVNHLPAERRIVGVLDRPDAAYTQLWFSNPHLSIGIDHPEPLGDLWVGSGGGTFRSYFTTGVHRHLLFDQPEPILAARMGVILVDAGGVRHPIYLSAFWDPPDGKWVIDFLNVGNHDPDNSLRFLF